MEPLSLRLLKITFIIIGLAGLFLSILYEQYVGMLLAGPFFLIGISFYLVKKYNDQKAKRLKSFGKMILTDFKEVRVNASLEMNGRNPNKVISRWYDKDNHTLYIFKSVNIWYDPAMFLEERKIPVYINPNNPKDYYMDLSFLPKVIDA